MASDITFFPGSHSLSKQLRREIADCPAHFWAGKKEINMYLRLLVVYDSSAVSFSFYFFVVNDASPSPIKGAHYKLVPGSPVDIILLP
jgi:hypothetical protein